VGLALEASAVKQSVTHWKEQAGMHARPAGYSMLSDGWPEL